MMLSPQLPFNQNLGLIWWKSNIGGRIVWGHGGSDYGARAQMHFDPETKIGIVVLTNGEANILQIVNKLFEFAENLPNNSPPTSPEINGPLVGKVGISYNWTFITTDPDGNDVYYYITWDDGHVEAWDGPYASGEDVVIPHCYAKQGTYTIKAKAKDIYGAESDWSESILTMPRDKAIQNTMFEWFLERYPLLNKLLLFIIMI